MAGCNGCLEPLYRLFYTQEEIDAERQRMEELRAAMNVGIHGAVYLNAIERALVGRDRFRPELFGTYVGAITIDWYEHAGRKIYGDVDQIRIADLTYNIATPPEGAGPIYIDLDMIRSVVIQQCADLGINFDDYAARHEFDLV